MQAFKLAASSSSRQIANTAGLVCIEDLKTSSMTRSAKGTIEDPGTNVSQKSGLNRSILETGWSALRQKLEYTGSTQVIAINPAYTSQTCSECGTVDAGSRKSQSEFECVACGHESNADVNAALNILASGTGASGRRGALTLVTPTNRQNVFQSASPL